MDPAKSLKDYMATHGISTSTGGYIIRRDYKELGDWMSADLVWVQDIKYEPDYVEVYPYEPIGYTKRPSVQN